MCTVATSSESTMSLMSWLKKSEIDKPETEAVELTDTAELTTSDPLLGKPVQPSYQNDQSTMPKHPHQAIITFPLQKFGSQHRAFCSAWYKRFQWLHYQEYNSVLCFYCFVADKKHLEIRMICFAQLDSQTGSKLWRNLRNTRIHSPIMKLSTML